MAAYSLVAPVGSFYDWRAGGFTTFSSFSLQTLVLMRDGEWLLAGANATGSLALCLVAVVAGHLLAMALATHR